MEYGQAQRRQEPPQVPIQQCGDSQAIPGTVELFEPGPSCLRAALRAVFRVIAAAFAVVCMFIGGTLGLAGCVALVLTIVGALGIVCVVLFLGALCAGAIILGVYFLDPGGFTESCWPRLCNAVSSRGKP